MRHPSLRQIEAFRAVIESGTVKGAAELLHISQPAASKLLSSLELDTELNLFDRTSGRLVMTAQGMRLYEEIDRIFAGVDQISKAVERIRRENYARINVGVMPGLSGFFIAEVVSRFRRRYPNSHISIETRDSLFLIDWLTTRQLDVGILTLIPDPTHVAFEPLCEEPFWCILPVGHPKGDLEQITPDDLKDEPLIAYAPNSFTRGRLDSVFVKHGRPTESVIEASTAATVCEFVAAGLGVALVHPLIVEQVKERVIYKPFRPEIANGFLVCRPKMVRDGDLTASFISLAQQVARDMASNLRSGFRTSAS